MKKIALGMTTLALSLMALPSQAQIFKFEHNDTISFTNILGLSASQPAKITVALENGGTDINSETWTAAGLQWVKFDFNNGAVLTTFTAPFGGALSGSAGNFSTNASGVLLSVLSNWYDSSVGSNYSTNSGTPTQWYLDGSNSMYNASNGFVNLTNVASITTVGGWAAVGNASVPEPASFALLGLGLAGLAMARKRRAV